MSSEITGKNTESSNLQNRLLESILVMQNDFIKRGIYYGWCEDTLENLLFLSESEFGFICELLKKDDGTPYIKSHGITNIAWNDQTRRFYEENIEKGLEFFNFESLWGKAITTGEPVIANDPENDDRRGGYPREHGHPILKSFLALPINGAGGEVVGVMGVANRPNGYDDKIVAFLSPFVASYGVLIEKSRSDQQRKMLEIEREKLISDLKQNQEALKKSKAVLDATGRMARVGGWEMNAETLKVTWTEETYRIHEVPLDKKPPLQEAINFFHPEDRDRLSQAIQQALDHGEPYDMEIRFITANGNRLWTRTKCEPEIVEGKTVRLKGTFQDITDRKQAEEALRESEERFRVAQEISPDGFTILHPLRNEKNEIIDFTWVYQNQTIARINGTDSEDVIGKRLLELFPTHKATKIFEAYIDVANSGEPQVLPDVYASDVIGVPTWLRLVIVPLQGDIAIQSQDITERKQAEQRIKHLNRVLRSIRDVNQLIVRERDPEVLIHEGVRLLVENRGYTSVLIVLTDDEDQPLSCATAGIAYSSESLNAMLESQELPPCCHYLHSAKGSMLIDDRTGVCERCPISEERQEAVSLCARLIHGDSAFGYITASLESHLNVVDEELSLFSEMAGDLAYALNFSRIEAAHESSKRQRENLESQLVQAQKMESVGRLAGGVAHDYNNISSIIIGYSELALEKVEPSDPLHNDLMEIFGAAKRSTDITRQLLAFARQQTIAPKILDLNSTIGSMIKMLRRLIGEDIDLAWLPESVVWPVKMDPSQVDQILANLCVNARDAIADVGKVTIETENISFDADYCADHAGFVPGDYVLLAVSDDGIGMDAETLDKIFEPFFTTKGKGKGTGLGLATVYGIVKQNEGFINVYSEPDKGTSIKIYLSRHTGQDAEALAEENIEIPLSQSSEVVLLVEDDASILKLGERILENLGYRVLAANSPEEAIHLAEEQKGNIHLLITDVVMPGMNGCELSEKLQGSYPNLKTLFMSGYTANVIAHRGVLKDGVSFISKPFSKMELARKVREVLLEAKRSTHE